MNVVKDKEWKIKFEKNLEGRNNQHSFNKNFFTKLLGYQRNRIMNQRLNRQSRLPKKTFNTESQESNPKNIFSREN